MMDLSDMELIGALIAVEKIDDRTREFVDQYSDFMSKKQIDEATDLVKNADPGVIMDLMIAIKVYRSALGVVLSWTEMVLENGDSKDRRSPKFKFRQD